MSNVFEGTATLALLVSAGSASDELPKKLPFCPPRSQPLGSAPPIVVRMLNEREHITRQQESVTGWERRHLDNQKMVLSHLILIELASVFPGHDEPLVVCKQGRVFPKSAMQSPSRSL